VTAITAFLSVFCLEFLIQTQSTSDWVGHITAAITGERLAFGAIGLIFGFAFGLDGWNVFKRSVEFKDSRRFRGLRFAAVGVVVVIFGDLKSLGIQGDRLGLLASYVVGFVVATFSTIGIVALCLAIKYGRIKQKDPENYPPEPFNPVGDYFHLGYDGFKQSLTEAIERLREKQDEQGKQTYRDFPPAYSRAMRATIAAIEGFNKNPTVENKKALITQVLSSAITTVKAYRQIKDDILNANCMVLYTKESLPLEQKKKIRFFGSDVDRFRYFLAIEHWEDWEGSVDFVLPVEDLSDPQSVEKSLPGAPLALLQKSFQVVDDTYNMDFAERLRNDVKAELEAYFKGADFRSFGCVTVPGQLGVVVIQSTEKNVFGTSKKEKQQTADLLRPICDALKAALTPKSV
jgi:hypothetical protein